MTEILEAGREKTVRPAPVCPFGGNFPQARLKDSPLEPAPGYADFREEGPVVEVELYDGTKAWLVTRYDEVVDVLSDPRFSAIPNDGYPMISSGAAAAKRSERTFLRKDAPEHTVHRRMWMPHFTARQVKTMNETIQQIVDKHLAAMLAKGAPADFFADFALMVPTDVICLLLDVPDEDRDFFHTKGGIVVQLTNDPQVILDAREEIDDYWMRQIEVRERNPGKDIVSQLIQEQVHTGVITKRELAEMATLMLLAGHETTANMIALGTILMLQHPDQLEAMKADPSLVPGAVDECLRYLTIPQNGMCRLALEDVDVGGTRIKAGEGVIILLSSANRDPAIFERPDDFDIRRANARRHVAFSAGIHLCLGNILARAELIAVFGTLFNKVPTLRVAVPLDELDYKSQFFFYGVNALPVTW